MILNEILIKLDGDAADAIIAGGLIDVIAGDRIILGIYNFSCFENVFRCFDKIYIVLL